MQNGQENETSMDKVQRQNKSIQKYIPVGARFSAPVQTTLWAHIAPYTIGTGSLSREKSDRAMVLTTHPHLAPKLQLHLYCTTGPS